MDNTSIKRLLAIYLEKIKRLPLLIAKNGFRFILVLIVIDILVGGAMFYYYKVTLINYRAEVSLISTKFKEATYQSVIQKLEEREKQFNTIIKKEYVDPFYQPPEKTSSPKK